VGRGAFVDLVGKLALGGTHEVTRVFGTSSLLARLVLVQTLPGGILALPSNGGRRSDGEFTAVPEVEIKLGYQLGPYLSCTIGYNFLSWSRVVRPGQRIDRALSPAQIPTFAEFDPTQPPVRPLPLFTSTDFWVQGLSFGLEFQF